MALNKQFIDGEWRDGKSAIVYEMTNPYNNQVIDKVKLANKEDIDEAY